MSRLTNIKEKLSILKELSSSKIGHRDYSEVAVIPFQVHSYIEIMNCRMIDGCEAILLLIDNNHIIPSMAIIRALFENNAMIHRVVLSIERSLESDSLIGNFKDLITKITYGTRYNEDNQSINILTQMDKLDKSYNGIRKFYDEFCEFVHPNWDGVEGAYSILDIDEGNTMIGRVIDIEHPVYDWVEACFLANITIYLDSIEYLRKVLSDFAYLCEKELKNN